MLFLLRLAQASYQIHSHGGSGRVTVPRDKTSEKRSLRQRDGGARQPTDRRARRSFEHQKSLSGRVATSSNQQQMRWQRLLRQLASSTQRETMPSTGKQACVATPLTERGHPVCFTWYINPWHGHMHVILCGEIAVVAHEMPQQLSTDA